MEQKISKTINKNYRKNDPLGSYTGTCENNEIPIQDADDL